MIPDPTHINLIMVHGDRACLPISTEPGWPSVMFSNRQEAGKKLAQAIRKLNIPDPVILALPRGGVPIAREVADALDAPLELIMVRKIGVPMQPELAAAAVVNGRKP